MISSIYQFYHKSLLPDWQHFISALLFVIVSFGKHCFMRFVPLNKEVDACERFSSLNPQCGKIKQSSEKSCRQPLLWEGCGKSSTSTGLSSVSSNSLCSLQVKSEYAKLKETLGAVTQERDLALWERNQLQDKLENLEQVLKVRECTPRASVALEALTTNVAQIQVVVFVVAFWGFYLPKLAIAPCPAPASMPPPLRYVTFTSSV